MPYKILGLFEKFKFVQNSNWNELWFLYKSRNELPKARRVYKASLFISDNKCHMPHFLFAGKKIDFSGREYKEKWTKGVEWMSMILGSMTLAEIMSFRKRITSEISLQHAEPSRLTVVTRTESYLMPLSRCCCCCCVAVFSFWSPFLSLLHLTTAGSRCLFWLPGPVSLYQWLVPTHRRQSLNQTSHQPVIQNKGSF